MSQKNRYLQIFQWFGVLLLFVFGGFLMERNVSYFQTNLFLDKHAAPYDGLVVPVQNVPNWLSLDSSLWKSDYNSIPVNMLVPLPFYDANQLKTSNALLTWTNPSDQLIRNAKITYSTPYMGNYKLDGIEYAGAHLAVDIKMLVNTPIYAIGNGVVVKSASQASGFGNHIVIRHDNFPSFHNPSQLTTYFSSYSHLNSIAVAEGDIVTKGQNIGLSGQSGLASTPHLHFQIDNDEFYGNSLFVGKVPFHPFWAFDFKEASDAGLDFYTAINAGLGKDKAIAASINPMLYIQKYSSGTVQNVPTPPATPVVPPISNGDVMTPPDGIPPVNITDTPILHSSSPGSTPAASPTATQDVIPTSNNTDVDQNNTTVSVPIVEESPAVALRVLAENNSFVAEDETSDALQLLKKYKIIDGYVDGSFRPNAVVTRVEALKFILKSLNFNIQKTAPLPFKDTKMGGWYVNYVATAYQKNIVTGYPDKNFRPGQTVNRAEFLKILLKAMNVRPNMKVTQDVFADVRKESWYAPYVAYAKEKNLLETSSNLFKPEEGMTRAEVATIIRRVILLKVSGQQKYDSSISVANGKLNKYFGM